MQLISGRRKTGCRILHSPPLLIQALFSIRSRQPQNHFPKRLLFHFLVHIYMFITFSCIPCTKESINNRNKIYTLSCRGLKVFINEVWFQCLLEIMAKNTPRKRPIQYTFIDYLQKIAADKTCKAYLNEEPKTAWRRGYFAAISAPRRDSLVFLSIRQKANMVEHYNP